MPPEILTRLNADLKYINIYMRRIETLASTPYIESPVTSYFFHKLHRVIIFYFKIQNSSHQVQKGKAILFYFQIKDSGFCLSGVQSELKFRK